MNDLQKGVKMKRAVDFFDEGYACAVSMLLAYSEQFDLQEKNVVKIASCFGAGMGRLRKTCGALTGVTMVWVWHLAIQTLKIWKPNCKHTKKLESCFMSLKENIIHQIAQSY